MPATPVRDSGHSALVGRVPGRVRVAVDLMSGDAGAPPAIAAAERALRQHDDLDLLLVGNPVLLDDAADHLLRRYQGRVELLPAEQIVHMTDPPAHALRKLRQSSMRLAINAVKEGRADACVSAGNTGALMAIAKFVLKTVVGIDRPAIVSRIPSLRGGTLVLDLGANADCDAAQLVQFALMGSVLAQVLDETVSPSVALLNMGEEDIKGVEAVKGAAEILRASALNYTGFVEGDGIFLKDVDVVVADGYSGNVALKSSEGTAKLIAIMLREAFTRSWLHRAAALVAAPVLKQFANRIDPGRYNGATLVGLNGIVVKSHGSADARSFANAIGIARAEASHGLVDQLNARIAQGLAASGAAADQ